MDNSTSTGISWKSVQAAIDTLPPKPEPKEVLMSPLAYRELEKKLKNGLPWQPNLPLFRSYAGIDIHIDRSGIIDGYIMGPPGLIQSLLDLCNQAADGNDLAREIATKIIENIKEG